MRAWASIASISGCSLPFWTNARDVSTKRMRVSSHAAIEIVRARGEVEHRRHAPCGLQRHEGHRGAVGVGEHHADGLAGFGQAAILRATTATAMRNMRKLMAPLSGSSTAVRERPRAFGRRLERCVKRAPNIERQELEFGHPVVEREVLARAAALGALTGWR